MRLAVPRNYLNNYRHDTSTAPARYFVVLIDCVDRLLRVLLEKKRFCRRYNLPATDVLSPQHEHWTLGRIQPS